MNRLIITPLKIKAKKPIFLLGTSTFLVIDRVILIINEKLAFHLFYPFANRQDWYHLGLIHL